MIFFATIISIFVILIFTMQQAIENTPQQTVSQFPTPPGVLCTPGISKGATFPNFKLPT
jgi:hypothetical protein